MITQEDARVFLGRQSGVQLLWTDPPYGTDRKQELRSSGKSYVDSSRAEAVALVYDVCRLGLDTLTDDGVMAVCLDWRSVHDVIALVSPECNYLGDVVWHYETGGVSKRWWSQKHDTVALFSNSHRPRFNLDAVPVIERKAPVTRGGVAYTTPKRVSSVWNINMSTTDKQRVGYPNQKPLDLVLPFVEVHTDPGDLVVDPFCGSGTTLAAALSVGRRALGCDTNPEAVEIASKRLEAT